MILYQIRIDDENSAEDFWAAAGDSKHSINSLEPGSCMTLTPPEFLKLTDLPGWGSGPKYARFPVLVDEIRVGSRVTGGDTDEDRDSGEVLAILPDGQIEVAWEGAGSRTTINASIVEVVS